MGQSAYYGNGSSLVLPHAWQTDSYNTYQGNQYYVDPSSGYWMADPNASGYWQPLER